MKKFLIPVLFFIIYSCGNNTGPDDVTGDLEDIPYAPTAVTYKSPPGFPKMEFPADNAPTAEGIDLGRRLFYDPILSRDSTQGCFSCHKQELAFTDGQAFSTGIQGIPGVRSSMSLIDVGYNFRGLFWDGRAATLEDQALLPVEDFVELHTTWPEVEVKIRRNPAYPELFRKAFGIKDRKEISKTLVAKAIAQFERTIVSSGTSKYDLFKQNLAFLEGDESNGLDMFFDKAQPILPDAQCGHCHNDPLFTTNEYFNNGISPGNNAGQFTDKGRGLVTSDTNDIGKFRAPSLRNIMLTAPYMHDGRIANIDEVLNHYNSGGIPSAKRDPLIGKIHLTPLQKEQLLAFLKTLTDEAVLKDPAFSNPFK